MVEITHLLLSLPLVAPVVGCIPKRNKMINNIIKPTYLAKTLTKLTII